MHSGPPSFTDPSVAEVFAYLKRLDDASDEIQALREEAVQLLARLLDLEEDQEAVVVPLPIGCVGGPKLQSATEAVLR